MVRLAFKNLVQEPVRLLVSAAGIATVLVLILVLRGVFTGSAEQLVSYIERSDADVWVMQEGIANMHMANSMVPSDLEVALRSVPGVAAAEPVLYASNIVLAGGRQWFSYIVGVRPGAERGGPWAMGEGSASPGPGQVVIPDVLVRKAGVRLGGEVTILGRGFRVAGLSRETFSMANSVTFVSYRDMETLIAAPGAASYFLVKAAPSEPSDTLAARVRQRVPGVNALTREELAGNDRALVRQMGVDLIRVMSVIGFIVGTLIVGLTVYTATVRRAREYGIAKALGTRNRDLLGLVFLQATTIAVLGLALGVGVAYALRPVVATVAPEVPLLYSPGSILQVAASTAVMAVLSAMLPAYRIARVEPALVFKE
jgi:putative ABC transport system permease protein